MYMCIFSKAQHLFFGGGGGSEEYSKFYNEEKASTAARENAKQREMNSVTRSWSGLKTVQVGIFRNKAHEGLIIKA